MENTQPKKAALYCRLSVDDGRMGESVSIGSQKILLEQYCKDHAIENYETYDDDGYSGTNFDRPAFQRMYEDIKNGLIDVVLVKDQSRFGRSYIEVGMYVEKFKELGVRFIAVGDNFDSLVNENEVYLGRLIYGKQKCKSMKSKKKVKMPREEWIIVDNCHEPIISQELWDRAHKMMSVKRRPTNTGEVQMFAGLLYCADCGHALTYSQKKRSDGSYHGTYSYWMYKTHGKEYCASHYINYDVIYDIVLKDMRRVLKSYRKSKDEFRAFLSNKSSGISSQRIVQLKTELKKSQGRMAVHDVSIPVYPLAVLHTVVKGFGCLFTDSK